MNIHDDKKLDTMSKTIYETTILCKVNSSEYLKQIERIKNMVKEYSEKYLKDYIEITTSTNNNGEDDKEGKI